MVNQMQFAPWNARVNSTTYTAPSQTAGLGYPAAGIAGESGNFSQDSYAGSAWQPSEISAADFRQFRLNAAASNGNSATASSLVAPASEAAAE